MQNTFFSRRQFVQLTATGALAACAGCATGQGKSARKVPVGLQLYSVRHECEKDLSGTVSAVAKMGYQGVEFAGYYNRDAATLRKNLDDNGLKCCGTHIGLGTLLGDNLQKTVEFNKTIGNKFLIVPGLDEKYRKTRQAWAQTAELFNELSEKVTAYGMRVGYHNHTVEFSPLDGELPWDTFFGKTRKEVVMQFDTGNAMQGSGDPVVFLKKYPGRAATVHVKPFSKAKPNAVLGEDELPWNEIFNLCETSGGTEWYIVEYESDAYPPLVSVEKCFQAMRRWNKC